MGASVLTPDAARSQVREPSGDFRLRATALAAGYGATPRFQVIGDGATWIGNGAEVNFPKQIFTVDCYHALGYVAKVCEYLAESAGDAKEAGNTYRKARARLLEHDFERAEQYLKDKYRAHFTEDGMKHWSEEAAKAWKNLDARRSHMNYGWLRRHGYLIGSGHIESACKVGCGLRRTGVSGWAIGNSEGRLVSAEGRGRRRVLHGEQKEKTRKFRPHCPLPDPCPLGVIFSEFRNH